MEAIVSITDRANSAVMCCLSSWLYLSHCKLPNSVTSLTFWPVCNAVHLR